MTYSEFLKEVGDRKRHLPLEIRETFKDHMEPEYVLINKEVLEEMLKELWRSE